MRSNPLVAVFLLLGAAMAESQSRDPAPRAQRIVDLSGVWQFHPIESSEVTAPGTPHAHAVPQHGWRDIVVPGAWSSQGHPETNDAWYRREITLPAGLNAPQGLGLRVGEVWTDYEVFVNDVQLNALVPRGSGEYDRRAIFALPSSIQGETAQAPIVLLFHVTRRNPDVPSEGGLTARPLEIGSITELVRRDVLQDVPAVVMGAVFMLVGIVHILTYRKRQGLHEYLWFGLGAFDMGIYTFLRTQFRFSLPFSFSTMKETEYLCLYVLPVLFILFTQRFMETPIPRLLKAYLALQVALALFVSLSPGLGLNVRSLGPWYALVLPGLFVIGRTLVLAHRAGRRETSLIFTGVLIAITSFLIDLLTSARVLTWASFISPFGFAWLMVSISGALADRFSRVYADAAALSAAFERRVDERTEELNRVLSDAQAASRAKSTFLANISHEIRTPMNGVLGMSEILLRSNLNAEQTKEARLIQTSAGALLQVIDDVLDVSRIEAGKFTLRAAPFSPGELLSQVEHLLGPTVPALVALTVTPPDAQVKVVADAARFRQVVLNLVSNAIKFTSRGSVQVSARIEPIAANVAGVRVVVEDTGIGIAAEVLPRLFEPFSQADESTSRRFGGTGLGLSIARKLVELMGGEISVSSEPGVGSRFTFWIPAPLAEPGRPRPKTAEILASRAVSTPARILVAEDNLVNQAVVKKQLEALGHVVHVVGDGQAALRLIEDESKEPYDLVFLDCQMPILDGYETVRRIRESGNLKARGLPVVALSALAMETERAKSLEMGMDEHLAKPVTIHELSTVIDRLRRKS